MNAILALILSLCALLMSCTAMATTLDKLPAEGPQFVTIHITECNDPAPANPHKGDLWMAVCDDGKETRMYLWDGKAWLKAEDESTKPEFSA